MRSNNYREMVPKRFAECALFITSECDSPFQKYLTQRCSASNIRRYAMKYRSPDIRDSSIPLDLLRYMGFGISTLTLWPT